MNSSEYVIKNATLSKVKSKGFTPVTVYIRNYGYVTGWIFLFGRKWNHFYSFTTGRKRFLKSIKFKVLGEA